MKSTGAISLAGSYEAERLAYSRLLLAEVAGYLGRDVSWVEGKTVVSLGCGCTGDLAAFPAAVKIAIDPLLYAYQQLGMLVRAETGSRTVYLSLERRESSPARRHRRPRDLPERSRSHARPRCLP